MAKNLYKRKTTPAEVRHQKHTDDFSNDRRPGPPPSWWGGPGIAIAFLGVIIILMTLALKLL